MTLHIGYEYVCKNCGYKFIPYKEKSLCPHCGFPADETFDFIPRAIKSIKFNIKEVGSIHPGVWLVGSFADEILEHVFEILDTYDKTYPKPEFNEFAGLVLEQRIPEHEKFLRKHVLEILKEIVKELEKEGLYSIEKK